MDDYWGGKAVSGPYVNDDGDVWVERGSRPWPAIQREGFAMLDELGWGRLDGYQREYVGIEEGVRVSDEQEYSHGDDDGCADAQGVDADAPGFTPCCRTITAHHFRGVEQCCGAGGSTRHWVHCPSRAA